jgi:transposase
MAYSTDYRTRVLEFCYGEGHTLEETSRVFNVGITTIGEWRRLQKETGSLECRPLNREAQIFKDEELCAYIAKNPDATLQEIADNFGGSVTGAFYALERNKITIKKKNLITKSETMKNARPTTQL